MKEDIRDCKYPVKYCVYWYLKLFMFLAYKYIINSTCEINISF